MIRDHRVVAFIPWGRQQTACMLVPYLIRDHLAGVIDEVMLCINVARGDDGGIEKQQAADVAYAEELAKRYPGLFKVYRCPGPDTPELRGTGLVPEEWFDGYRNPKQLNTGRFYYWMQDRDAIYVRFDDDIVWLHTDAVANLVNFKLDHPELLGAFPVIWNNAVASYCLQQWGHLDYDHGGAVTPNALDRLGWHHAPFAEYVHGVLLHHLDHDHEDACLTTEIYELGKRQQFSVSCFAVSGNDYADLNGILDWDEEEHWLTMHRTGVIGRHNALWGMSHVAHLTFFPQRDYIWHQTDIPHRYWKHSQVLVDSLPEEWQWR